jgi:alkylhydroperoxidase/carboxymuconolactone decarboxylase family protein
MMKERNLGTLTGPVLIFGGAYSNLDALVAMQEEVERRGIPARNVICTGDTPGYCAEPQECLDLLENWGCHAIAGNVESNLVAGTDDCGCGFGDGSRCDMFAKLWYNYAAKHVTQRGLGFMAKLPDILRFKYAGRETVVLHGSPNNQSEFVWRSTAAAEKAQFCADAGAEVVVGGHCGLPFAHELAEAETPSPPPKAAAQLTPNHKTPSPTPPHGGGALGNAARSNDQQPATNLQPATSNLQPLWLNAGVIGMPANDGTPRTWFMVLNDATGFDYDFHPLNYDHRAAKSKMIDDRRLPVSYAATLTTGIWDNTEIMPPAEESREGIPLSPAVIKAEASPAFLTSPAPAAAPGKVSFKQKINLGEITNKQSPMNNYSDPKDLKSFGKIVEWQEDMGNKFFDWYSGVTEGDTALTAREKALIALAVSHAIQCAYCIDAYTTNSLQAGADEEQMMEAVHVAAAVKAGTTLIYARQMQRQVDKVTM